MAQGKVTLELSIEEWRVIENALSNYKGRIIHLSRNNEGSYEEYTKLTKEEKFIHPNTIDTLNYLEAKVGNTATK